jgi:hypothetical protein
MFIENLKQFDANMLKELGEQNAQLETKTAELESELAICKKALITAIEMDSICTTCFVGCRKNTKGHRDMCIKKQADHLLGRAKAEIEE